jgi:hypothetical protein
MMGKKIQYLFYGDYIQIKMLNGENAIKTHATILP